VGGPRARAGLAGITIVTVNPTLRPRELAHVLGHSRADGIFLVPEYRGTPMTDSLESVRGDLPALREVVSLADWDAFCASGSPTERLPAIDPGDAAQIQYTSGTTGGPKGVVLNHRGIVNNARLYVDRIALDRGTVQLSPMPLFHTAGCLMSVLGAIANEGTLVLPPSFDPGLVLELVEAERVEHLLGVPTMLVALLDDPAFATTDTSSVRRLLSGGAVVPPGLVARAEAAFGAPLSIVFAQTEASPAITQTAPQDDPADRAMTLGRPLPQTEVKIVDFVSAATVGPDVIGELCTRGYHVMSGYFDDPAATDAAVDTDGGCTPATSRRWTPAATAGSAAA
jgi:acyl-CoA synthetase (AMP-forming)/AMP-acid ligase II